MISDIKTTAAGTVAGACQMAGFFVPGLHAICDPISAIALFLIGLFAKDK